MNVWTKDAAAVPAIQATVDDRLVFLKKVYSLLLLSIGVGVISSYFVLTTPVFLQTVAGNIWLFFIAEIAVLFFAFWARKKETLNFIALFGFTILTGITTAPLIYAYQSVAGQAAMLTVLAFGGLTAYVFVTKKDFSFLRGFLIVSVLVLIVGGLLNAFFFKSLDAAYFMSAGGVLIFCGFILYDTSNIMRVYPTDEYISATLSLYLDILNLFIHILTFLGLSKD